MTAAALPVGSRPAARRRVPSAWIARRPQISGEQFPLDVDLSPSRLGAMILCGAGVFFLWSSWEFLEQIFRAEEAVFVGIASVFPLIGIGLIAAGLVQMYRRQNVRFGEAGVEVTERNLIGSRRWSAAYSDYVGVLQREHVVRRKNHSTTYQVIQLVHPDPSRDLPLHVSRGETLPRERWESLARRLRLPALQLDDDRITSRPADTLDHSLSEQLRADHATAGIGSGPAPAAISVSEDSRGLLIEVKRGRLQPVAYVVFALFPLTFIAVGIITPDALPQMVIGIVLLAVLGWLGWKDATSRRAIGFTPDSIAHLDEWRWTMADAEKLYLHEIEGVRIYRSGKLASRVIVIEGDRGSMHVGQGLTRSELAWLRDFLVAQIAARVRRPF